MFRTIVIGCAGTEPAADAVALAQRLRHPEGRLVLVAVHPRFGPLPDRRGGYHYAGYMAEQARETLDRAAAGLAADVPADRRVVADDSVTGALHEVAMQEEADLLVLGSTHYGRVGRLTGRTTVQHLIQGAPCAVAVAVPDRLDADPASGVVCVAYDGSPASADAAHTAFALAAATGASVRLVRVIEPIAYLAPYVPLPDDLDAESELRSFAAASLAELAELAPAGVAVERLVTAGPAAPTLLEHARDADLLVAGSRHYGPLHRLFAGSVSTRLLTDGSVPVLVTARPSAAPGGPAGPAPDAAGALPSAAAPHTTVV
jgi:nucleotide-binding universal stress UspA family protein